MQSLLTVSPQFNSQITLETRLALPITDDEAAPDPHNDDQLLLSLSRRAFVARARWLADRAECGKPVSSTDVERLVRLREAMEQFAGVESAA